MAVVEYVVPGRQVDVTAEFDMSEVNDCVIHGVKPVFVKNTAKRNKQNVLLIVQCKSEACMRCTDGYYDRDANSTIVGIWNKWNPKPEGKDDHCPERCSE